MLEIRPLAELSENDLRRILTGYTAHEKYRVSYTSTDQATTFSLELVSLAEPYTQHFNPGEDEIEMIRRNLRAGWSLGAFDGLELVAVAIASPETWNGTLRIWEFHVAASHRRMGLGQQMMDQLAHHGAESGLRAMVVETQSTNVPAIRFYRKAGFVLEGIDISYYTNHDYPDGEMAVFLKRRL
jgi:ribosomal protein S18 acetylase RimI-like enzyme